MIPCVLRLREPHPNGATSGVPCRCIAMLTCALLEPKFAAETHVPPYGGTSLLEKRRLLASGQNPHLHPRLRECAASVRDTFYRLKIKALTRLDGVASPNVFSLEEAAPHLFAGPGFTPLGQNHWSVRCLASLHLFIGSPNRLPEGSRSKRKQDTFNRCLQRTSQSRVLYQKRVRPNSRVRPSVPAILHLSAPENRSALILRRKPRVSAPLTRSAQLWRSRPYRRMPRLRVPSREDARIPKGFARASRPNPSYQ